jgi:hypothetical protein
MESDFVGHDDFAEDTMFNERRIKEKTTTKNIKFLLKEPIILQPLE